jgi:hypothetical protein
MVIVLAIAGTQTGRAENVVYNEHQVKAAFLYNFIKFSEWPRNKPAEPNTIIIGLLGDHPFKDAFDAVKDKPIDDKRLIIRDFGKFNQYIKDSENKVQLTKEAEQLKKCHLLFVCDSEWAYTREIIEAVQGSNVLTVGETADFIDLGGIITFVPANDKIAFEINTKAAKQAKIQINTRVLRLAKRIKSD